MSRHCWASVFASLLLVTASSRTIPATAAFLTTADGKATLHIYREQLTFPDKDLSLIGLYANACQPESDGHSPGLDLRTWASDPRAAACFDSIFPTARTSDIDNRFAVGTGLNLHVQPDAIPLNAPFIGRSPPVPYPAISMRIGLAGGIDRPGCDGGTEPDFAAQGFTRTHLFGEHPREYAYVLPAGMRLAAATRPLCVRCHDTPSLAYDCTINLTSSDHYAVLELTWLESDFAGPRASWTSYDLEARAMADSIFRHRPAGYLQ